MQKLISDLKGWKSSDMILVDKVLLFPVMCYGSLYLGLALFRLGFISGSMVIFEQGCFKF